MAFGDSEFDGLDEIFPNLTARKAAAGKPELLDHGEVWQLPWKVVAGPGISLEVEGRLAPYRFARSITIDDGVATFAYAVTNTGASDLPYAYCFHPLFALDESTQLELRPEQPMVVLYSSDGVLGAAGRGCTWSELLDGGLKGIAGKAGRGWFWKAVATNVTDARIGVRWSDGAVCTMSWSGEIMPHCAIWTTEGKILDGMLHIAPEPCVSTKDAFDDAVAAGESRLLKPGATDRWMIRLAIAAKGR